MFPPEVQDLVDDLESRGYAQISDLTKSLRTDQRVRHGGHRWPEAYDKGTATVVAVFEKSPSAWSQTWGARDVEVLVQTDEGRFTLWANYTTETIRSTA